MASKKRQKDCDRAPAVWVLELAQTVNLVCKRKNSKKIKTKMYIFCEKNKTDKTIKSKLKSQYEHFRSAHLKSVI